MSEPRYKLYPGWIGYYTRKGGTKYYWCKIIAFDRGEPVIRTAKGRYHRRPTSDYIFITRNPEHYPHATP